MSIRSATARRRAVFGSAVRTCIEALEVRRLLSAPTLLDPQPRNQRPD